MALGQYIAGMGFSNVGLGIAHSMAHTLGAVYDTPHGVACAMTLPHGHGVSTQEATGEKYREIARAMGVKNVDSMTPGRIRARPPSTPCASCPPTWASPPSWRR